MSVSVRSRLLTLLTPRAITRVSIDFGGGVALTCLAAPVAALGRTASLRWPVLLLLIPALAGGGIAGVLCAGFLRRAARLLGEASAARRRLTAGAVSLAVIGVLAITVSGHGGPRSAAAVLGRALAATLPAILVAVVGGWACLLIERRAGASPSRWRRRVPDLLAMLATGLTGLVLVRRDLLATEPAAGLLFPLAAWASFRAWRVMGRSGRLAVRAAADIVFSLLLGASLVLLLVWAGNLLDLPAAEIAVLRGTLERIGDLVDLPWWMWAGLYVLLSGASLAVAVRPEALAAISSWGQRLRVVPAVDVTRRVMSGVHISLAVTVLLALSAPPAVGAVLSRRVQATYTLALQREVTAGAERTAYAEIRRRFAAGVTVPSMGPLASVLDRLHRISRPPPGRDEATGTERDLARRLGQIQATALRVTPPPAAEAAAGSSAAAASGPAAGGPAAGGSGAGGPGAGGPAARADERLAALDAERRRARTVTRQADQAGELAAAAVAAAIQVPGLGDHELVQILTEYLSGLVESGPIKDTFAAWARRLAARTAPPPAGRQVVPPRAGRVVVPPPADRLVVPDPVVLADAALIVLVRERLRVRLADPLAGDPAQQRTLGESPAAAAVDLANEARFLAEGTGPCAGCPRPARPGDEPGEGPEDHPEEPREPVR
jgi:hypothetical protein